MFSFPNPGSYFGPSDMLYAYKNMECSVAGGICTIAVNKYRNANKGSHKEGGTQQSWPLRQWLRQAAPDTIARAGGAKAWADVFLGKGSPWAIASVLEDFAIHSEKFIKLFRKADAVKMPEAVAVAKILEDPTLSWEQTLQQICDGWLGLDCNGFVGNWLRIVNPSFKLTPDDRADNVRQKAKAYRTSLAEIEYWDVMCYAKNEHIAAVNKATATPGHFLVCQSAGGGPRMNEFQFLKTAPNRFKLAAPTRNDIGYDFYVVSLW